MRLHHCLYIDRFVAPDVNKLMLFRGQARWPKMMPAGVS
jgi:hypothetical protein